MLFLEVRFQYTACVYQVGFWKHLVLKTLRMLHDELIEWAGYLWST